jgi:microcystin-dependent protein
MTVQITPIFANTNTFGDWLTKTNEIASALSTQVLSINASTPPTGNAVVQGSFSTNTVHVQTLSGGTRTVANTLTINTAINIANNATFSGLDNILGVPSSYTLTGANATHYTLAANTSTGRLRFMRGLEMNVPVTGNIEISGDYVGNDISANNVVAINISGNGFSITALNGSAITTGTIAAARVGVLPASKITSGIIAPARLATGTADNLTFLRGDSTWQQLNVDTEGNVTSINADNITLGIVLAQFLGSGTANTSTYLLGNNTWSSLNASHVLSGTLPSARLTGSYTGITGVGTLTTGSIGSGFGNINIGTSTFAGNGSGLNSLNGSNIATGTVAAARIDALPASQITSGIFASARLSGSYTGITGVSELTAGSITTTFGNINIGTSTFTGNGSGLNSLNGSNIATGTVAVDRLSDIPASKVTSGTFEQARLGGGSPSSITFLRGDGVWSAIDSFPTGTRMLFQQTTAPIGWTKVTDSAANNKALRIVTGTAGSGGTQNFTTAFATGRATTSAGDHSHTITVSNHTLTTAQIPSHTHTFSATSSAAGSHSHTGSTGTAGSHSHTGSTNTTGSHTHNTNIVISGDDPGGFPQALAAGAFNFINTAAAGDHSHSLFINAAGDHAHTLSINAVGDHSHSISGTTGATGSGSGHNHAASSNSTGAHTHTLNMDVAYIDLIIATKN